ncbi:MAG: flavin reductase family protein [Anaerovoracaceae bacterium]|nr:flavin reductase family protein [Anaerovoracaceae bacterium]
MGKRSFKGGAMLNPVPAVMVSCGSRKPNIITIAWTGIVNSNPPMTYISVRKERYSHNIIENTGEFVINLCSEELAFATDFCGVRSGRDTDKFKEMKLTPERAEIVRCPMIKESPVNIECRVREIIGLGSHDMFIADILRVHVDEQYIDQADRIRLDQASLVAYNHGEYFGLKRQPIGKFGFSVMKPKTRKRINREKQGGNRRTGIKKTK